MTIQQEMMSRGVEHQFMSSAYRRLAKDDGPMSDYFKDQAVREMGMSMLCFSLARPTNFVSVTI